MGMMKPIPVDGGGTGSTTAAGAKVNLTVDDYTPGDGANWDPDPTTQPGALDQLAQRMTSVEALGAGASDGAPAYSTASADAQPANLTGRVMDCSSSALVITLPATPSANHLVGACKGAGASTNRLYVRPAGTGKLLGSQQLITLGTQYELSEFQYVDSTYGWLMRRPGAAGLFCPIPSGTQFLMLPNATWTQSGGLVSNVKDQSGNGYDAAEATNKPTYSATGINSGPALDFDGSNDVLSANATILNTTGAWFVAFTFIADDVTTIQAVISKQDLSGSVENSMTIQINGGFIYTYAIDEAASSAAIGKQSSAISIGTKYTIVATYDGGSNTTTSVKMYMNGVDQTTTNNAGTFGSVTSAAGGFRLGHRIAAGGGAERFYNGKMNWCIAGTGTPTAAEISAWYTFGNSL